MSQNQGGLTEDELRDYINDKYSLRLERGIFLKPNRDVIIDIYQRFLDEFWPLSRRDPGAFRDPEEQAPIKALMVNYLRIIIKIYNNSHSFNITDLISPVRHRTRLTLNILIYHRERVQDILTKWQEDKEELMAEEEEVQQTKQELTKLKEKIEELAIAISSAKPVEELKLAIIEDEKELELLKRRCDDIGAEAKEVKTKNLSKRESLEKDQASAEERKQEVEGLKKQLEILNNGLHIEQKISDAERMISEGENQLNLIRANISKTTKKVSELERLVSVQRLFNNEGAPRLNNMINRVKDFETESGAQKLKIERVKNSIVEHQKKEEFMRKNLETSILRVQEREVSIKTAQEKNRTNLETKRSEHRDRERAPLKEIAQIDKEIEDIKKARAFAKSKFNEETERHKGYMGQADRKVKLFEDKARKLKELREQNLTILAERRDKIESLLGVDIPEVDTPANRTYIK